MNNQLPRHAISFVIFSALAMANLFVLHARADDKLAPAELIAKHLESIGSAEARAHVRGTRIKGSCTITVKQGGTGQAEGLAMMASQGSQNLINMTFEPDTTPTWMRFDGNKVSVSQFRPGRRTQLEQFFASYDVVIREGLMGGTLSASWPLLNLQSKNPKLEYAGLKKINGKALHALRYSPRKGSDLQIVLFFDPETFRHVRTGYSQTIAASEQRRIGGGGPGLPPEQRQQATGARLEAYEEFSDFKLEDGLTLPHTYKFELSIQSEVKPALIDWVFNLTDYNFNAPLEASEFSSGKDTAKEKSN